MWRRDGTSIPAARRVYQGIGAKLRSASNRALACLIPPAYSRPGGAAPLCYPNGVTAAMIEPDRQRQELTRTARPLLAQSRHRHSINTLENPRRERWRPHDACGKSDEGCV
jgi:hypothetical protein